MEQEQGDVMGKNIGLTLQQAREDKSLAIADVSEELRISQQVLNLMESNRFDEINQKAFIRGYIRSYARFLNIDEESLISAYNNMFDNTSAQSASVSTKIDPLPTVKGLKVKHVSAGKKSLVNWLGLVLVFFGAGLLAYLGYYAFSHHQANSSSATHQQAQEASDATSAGQEADVPTPPQDATQGNIDASNTLNTSSENNAELPVDSTSNTQTVSTLSANVQTNNTDAPNTTTANIKAIAIGSGTDELVVHFVVNTKVTIKDATDKVLFKGLKLAGTQLNVKGKAPFKVRRVSDRAVNLELNGKQATTNANKTVIEQSTPVQPTGIAPQAAVSSDQPTVVPSVSNP